MVVYWMWRKYRSSCLVFFLMGTLLLFSSLGAYAGDLREIREAGVLRHLGIPYANFVTGSGDGLDVELIQLFARHLGVAYQ